MDLTYDDVQAILKIVDSSAIEELHLEIGEFKLVVRRRGAAAGTPDDAGRAVGAPPSAPSVVERVTTTSEPSAAGPIERTAPAEATASTARRHPAEARPPRDGVEVKAPMVGTFYRAPAPGAPPFVEVGSVVEADDTVCIVDVMKLMNSIPAGCRGRVVDICAENAALVEFGQTLMVIEPLP